MKTFDNLFPEFKGVEGLQAQDAVTIIETARSVIKGGACLPDRAFLALFGIMVSRLPEKHRQAAFDVLHDAARKVLHSSTVLEGGAISDMLVRRVLQPLELGQRKLSAEINWPLCVLDIVMVDTGDDPRATAARKSFFAEAGDALYKGLRSVEDCVMRAKPDNKNVTTVIKQTCLERVRRLAAMYEQEVAKPALEDLKARADSAEAKVADLERQLQVAKTEITRLGKRKNRPASGAGAGAGSGDRAELEEDQEVAPEPIAKRTRRVK